ncbi:GNAT family N-acetyltransferase [Antarctobacter jejuensis]|uniref:GNAT family N-acetyltransferase n=1 Tax=Antarctobacter jejuensis TaxID=1439938 RepID=UPI003FD023B5
MIRTARLLLRPARPTDLEALHAVFSDPRAMRYWDRPAYEDIALTRRFLRGFMATGDGRVEYILDREGRCIGKAGMWRDREIGYILHPDHWRQGLAYEALSAILPEIPRQRPDITELTAELDPRNIASARLLEKLGFLHQRTEEKSFLYGGTEWCDTAYYTRALPI